MLQKSTWPELSHYLPVGASTDSPEYDLASPPIRERLIFGFSRDPLSKRKQTALPWNRSGPSRMLAMMRRIIVVLCLFLCSRDMCPRSCPGRAYVITPLHSNAVTLTYSFITNGDNHFLTETSPVTDSSARINVSVA